MLQIIVLPSFGQQEYCETHFMQDEAPPHSFLTCQRSKTAILLVGGLGVGNHRNGLHEVQILIHVICFV
jgi:hypothetical protein